MNSMTAVTCDCDIGHMNSKGPVKEHGWQATYGIFIVDEVKGYNRPEISCKDLGKGKENEDRDTPVK
jgi:hypothetical protein